MNDRLAVNFPSREGPAWSLRASAAAAAEGMLRGEWARRQLIAAIRRVERRVERARAVMARAQRDHEQSP